MRTIELNQTRYAAFCRVVFLFVVISILCYSLHAEVLIKGKVTNSDDGSPVVGATVQIKGGSAGTVTDYLGAYSIQVRDYSAVLVFSYVGFISQEVKLKSGMQELNVVFKPEQQSLQEIVVIASDCGGKRAAKDKSYCVSTALQGRTSGMAVNDYYNQPSSAPVFYDPSEESYSKIHENGFKISKTDPLSTFSIDVDKASYTNVKRFILEGQIPPADAVRVEELINYFEYDYPQPADEHPFSINTEYSDCPWQEGHKILQIGLQGKKISTENLPPSNLVFLIDVSGSMDMPNKLPLVKAAFRLLVNNLRKQDHVAIVVYAGAAGLVLPSTNGDRKEKIMNAISALSAGGSTAGCEGISLAYKVAKENFITGGNNRVILATDGDFNVGISSENGLEDFIVEKRKDNIYLTCLGFGMGNYKDSKIELLADKGNGNYAYINDIMEANKVFVNEFGGTLFTIAKDVKIQIEFNPAKIAAYRLVGYENRMLNNEDFKDDAKDAGELGSGHTVTAIYEVIPVGIESKYIKGSTSLKYQQSKISESSGLNEIATVKFRYKKPDGDKSIEMVHSIVDKNEAFESASNNLKFSSSVAMFGMLLRNSEFKGTASFPGLIEIASNSRGYDKEGYRAEFIRIAKTAENLVPTAEK